MAMFIRVDVKDEVVRKKAGLAKQLVDSCPVDIFALATDQASVRVVEDNVDECTLCERCLQASPDGVQVVKLYE